MRVRCHLRALRGDRTIREMERLTGIHRGYLSRYERGKEFPRDHHVPMLEEAYGAPASDWYHGHVWLEIERDAE